MKQHKSKFSDLVFTDVQATRADKLLEYHFKNYQTCIGLDRATVFLTHRCNLFCLYCNGPHLNDQIAPAKRQEMLSTDIDLALMDKLLATWQKHGLQYIHFTGGEPTLNGDLPEIIKLAHKHQILTAITTNGSAGGAFYRQLIENGLYEIRLSLDTFDAKTFDQNVGVNGVFAKVQESLREIVRLRDIEQKDVFLIINMTVGTFNIDALQSILQNLIKSGPPNDLKLLLVAEEKASVQPHASRTLVNNLLLYLEQQDLQMELLEDKIRHFFRKNQFGLQGPDARYLMKHCYIPLSERTIDARGIYPCSIYLRYYGQPIADIHDSYERQQMTINEFVKSHDCREDEICNNFCTRCTREFNLLVNRKIRDTSMQRIVQPANSLGFIPAERIRTMESIYQSIQARSLPEFQPFVIIKPYGIPYREEIKAYLQEQGIAIRERIPLPNWNDFSLFLYIWDWQVSHIETRRYLLNWAYRFLDTGSAEVWLLDEKVSLKKLARIKGEVRNWFGKTIEEVEIPEYKKLVVERNAMHTPDEGRVEVELRLIKYWQQCDSYQGTARPVEIRGQA